MNYQCTCLCSDIDCVKALRRDVGARKVSHILQPLLQQGFAPIVKVFSKATQQVDAAKTVKVLVQSFYWHGIKDVDMLPTKQAALHHAQTRVRATLRPGPPLRQQLTTPPTKFRLESRGSASFFHPHPPASLHALYSFHAYSNTWMMSSHPGMLCTEHLHVLDSTHTSMTSCSCRAGNSSSKCVNFSAGTMSFTLLKCFKFNKSHCSTKSAMYRPSVMWHSRTLLSGSMTHWILQHAKASTLSPQLANTQCRCTAETCGSLPSNPASQLSRIAVGSAAFAP